jgi:hypothetical protein
MARPWYADPLETLKEQRWVPGANHAPPAEWLESQEVVQTEGPPMGVWS